MPPGTTGIEPRPTGVRGNHANLYTTAPGVNTTKKMNANWLPFTTTPAMPVPLFTLCSVEPLSFCRNHVFSTSGLFLFTFSQDAPGSHLVFHFRNSLESLSGRHFSFTLSTSSTVFTEFRKISVQNPYSRNLSGSKDQMFVIGSWAEKFRNENTLARFSTKLA